ncbi:TetR/AcrR family transcriptional regulator [Algoriphagus sp. A40]|uniref:TetR/AcrR family transcriptional regulator n=1 Tax=Algoriphagus sp. A40 TaxID=1945863 RepID=UPI00098715B8|nr:TetR/AcrR family transcriptional regulator [Algoriphagus sp. A40]OOG76545.1 hypothetical protein B0E43_08685 [Algoriphagus sp. A40]
MQLVKVSKALELGRKGSYQIWMDAGYAIFSEEGPSGIQVERLARDLDKNKSGFYHFFGDKEAFFELLMKEHLGRLDLLSYQIRRIKDFDPEYIQFLMENRETVLFQIQLVRHRENPLFAKTMNQFSERATAAVLPVWSSYLGTSVTISGKLWGIIRDTFYSRVTPDNFNFEWMSELSREVKNLIKKE